MRGRDERARHAAWRADLGRRSEPNHGVGCAWAHLENGTREAEREIGIRPQSRAPAADDMGKRYGAAALATDVITTGRSETTGPRPVIYVWITPERF